MFEGYARLAFIDSEGTRHEPGEEIKLPTETVAQKADVDGLRKMGVIVVTNPAGEIEELDDTATINAEREKVAPKNRAQYAQAKKAEREGKA